VSTIVIEHLASAPSPRAVRLDHSVYVRRRLVAALVAVAVAVSTVVALALLAGLGGDPAAASERRPAPSLTPAVHVAQPGDTLWDIADLYRGDVDRDRYLRALIERNDGTAIQAGQAVLLP